MSDFKEKKLEKPCSVKFRPSTMDALERAVQKEDRPLSYVIERAVRRDLGIDSSKR